jgi:hypothetical protein
LYITVSIIKKVLNIDTEGFITQLGIFKLDKKTIPTLLIIGWFGLLFHSLESLGFLSGIALKLLCVLLFLMCILILKHIQITIQGWLLTKKRKTLGDPTLPDGDRKRTYVERSGFLYLDIIVSVFVVLFTLLFGFLKFGVIPTILIGILSITFFRTIIRDQMNSISKDLITW